MNITEEEVWKDIPGYEGYFRISSFGRIISNSRLVATARGTRMKSEKLLHPSNSHGYLSVPLCLNGVKTRFSVHELVWKTFGEGVNSHDMHIDHINAIKTDNRISNLQLIPARVNSVKDRTTLTGVCFHKRDKRYYSAIVINRKSIHLGIFDTPMEAHMAYKKALKQHNERVQRHS